MQYHNDMPPDEQQNCNTPDQITITEANTINNASTTKMNIDLTISLFQEKQDNPLNDKTNQKEVTIPPNQIQHQPYLIRIPKLFITQHRTLIPNFFDKTNNKSRGKTSLLTIDLIAISKNAINNNYYPCIKRAMNLRAWIFNQNTRIISEYISKALIAYASTERVAGNGRIAYCICKIWRVISSGLSKQSRLELLRSNPAHKKNFWRQTESGLAMFYSTLALTSSTARE